MAAWWWIGLIGSWVAILVILKLVLLVLRVLKHIRRLAVIDAQAAATLADNLSAAERLTAVGDAAERLAEAGARLAAEADGVERTVASLPQAAGGGRS